MAGVSVWVWTALSGPKISEWTQQKILLGSVQTEGIQRAKSVTCRNETAMFRVKFSGYSVSYPQSSRLSRGGNLLSRRARGRSWGAYAADHAPARCGILEHLFPIRKLTLDGRTFVQYKWTINGDWNTIEAAPLVPADGGFSLRGILTKTCPTETWIGTVEQVKDNMANYLTNGGVQVKGTFRPAAITTTAKERKQIAVYTPCCFHCGRTQNLLTIKRADGRDWTICRDYARYMEMRGVL